MCSMPCCPISLRNLRTLHPFTHPASVPAPPSKPLAIELPHSSARVTRKSFSPAAARSPTITPSLASLLRLCPPYLHLRNQLPLVTSSPPPSSTKLFSTPAKLSKKKAFASPICRPIARD